jgi:hypothetical protein
MDFILPVDIPIVKTVPSVNWLPYAGWF